MHGPASAAGRPHALGAAAATHVGQPVCGSTTGDSHCPHARIRFAGVVQVGAVKHEGRPVFVSTVGASPFLHGAAAGAGGPGSGAPRVVAAANATNAIGEAQARRRSQALRGRRWEVGGGVTARVASR